ncbi:MAG: hypothetical protein RMH75_05465, partial [Archaeoglobaceae archaeon]|nr:hypothetical protein [Archaeoglobaceae archaeon]
YSVLFYGGARYQDPGGLLEKIYRNEVKAWVNDTEIEIHTERLMEYAGCPRELCYALILQGTALSGIDDDPLLVTPLIENLEIKGDTYSLLI